MSEPNYIVRLNNSLEDHNCDTERDVWKVIDKQGWGGYEVWSPVGLDVSEFLPF